MEEDEEEEEEESNDKGYISDEWGGGLLLNKWRR